MPRARRAAGIEEFALPGSELDTEGAPQTPAKATPARARSRARATGTTGTGRGKIGVRTPTGQIMSEAQMRDKVRTDVYAYLVMAAGGWSMVDPCGDLLFETVTKPPQYAGMERVSAIAEKITDILARNKAVLAFVAKYGIIGDLAALGMLIAPLAKAVYAAHGPGGYGHGDQAVRAEAEDATRYPAYLG